MSALRVLLYYISAFKKVHWSFLLLLMPFSQNQEDVEHPALSQLKLKDYELGERLGEGSSNGAVYAAKYNEHDVSKYFVMNCLHTSIKFFLLASSFVSFLTVLRCICCS